jgi:hypothetical protein
VNSGFYFCLYLFKFKKEYSIWKARGFLKKRKCFSGFKGRLAFEGILHWVDNESGQCCGCKSSVIKKELQRQTKTRSKQPVKMTWLLPSKFT